MTGYQKLKKQNEKMKKAIELSLKQIEERINGAYLYNPEDKLTLEDLIIFQDVQINLSEVLLDIK